MKQELAKAATTAVAEVDDVLYEDAGQGAEGVTSSDLALPFIKVAQKLSPEVDENKAEYIEGLKVGDFFNSVTQRIWKGKEGLDFIPFYYQRKFLEWGPERGDGFKGEHGPEIMNQTTREETARGVRNVLTNGNIIVETGTWYVLILDRETGEAKPAVIPFSSTQLKKSRQLLTRLVDIQLPRPDGKGMYQPAIWYNVIRATSSPEGNDRGDWSGWVLKVDTLKVGPKTETFPGSAAVYARAKELCAQAKAGQLQTARPLESEVDEDTKDGPAPF